MTNTDEFKYTYFVPVSIPNSSIEYVVRFRPYAGELVILSATDMAKGFGFTMRDRGAEFYPTSPVR
jgi:hypothetical protein